MISYAIYCTFLGASWKVFGISLTFTSLHFICQAGQPSQDDDGGAAYLGPALSATFLRTRRMPTTATDAPQRGSNQQNHLTCSHGSTRPREHEAGSVALKGSDRVTDPSARNNTRTRFPSFRHRKQTETAISAAAAAAAARHALRSANSAPAKQQLQHKSSSNVCSPG